jgi:DMSO/TMAO reductase YedYZ molybdopterin-dependent catalytic subunit
VDGPTPEDSPTLEPTPCVLDPIVAPTPPAEVPGYTELDPATGLHMTGTPAEIDLATYQLEVTGKVDTPLSLTFDDLRCMPRIEQRCTLTCPGFFQDEATWAGASLDHVLEVAQVQAAATGIRLISADGYETIVPLLDLAPRDDFLAYEWEGEPLPILHGFPVRAVFPSLNGNKWVKWLIRIDVY